MNQEQEQTNVVEFKKRKHLNIGLIIFGIIFVYLIATIVMYLTAPRVTVYEVRQGSILKDTAYNGSKCVQGWLYQLLYAGFE